MIRKNWWIAASIFIPSLIIFHQSLSYYFFQDDWFVLNWAKTGNLLSFFSFRTDIIYWRPLSMPFFFALSKSLFGLNPFGFHVLALLFHFTNILLVYLFARLLKFKKPTAIFCAFIWGVSAFHFVPLSWLSTTSYIIGPTFILTTIILFLKSKFKTSLLFFALALCSTELSLVVPALILIVDPKPEKRFKNLLPFLLLIIPYVAARFLIFPAPTHSEYAPIVSSKILVNSIWYFSWIFNTAERFSTIFYLSQINSWWILVKEFSSLLAGPVFLMASFTALLLVTKPKTKVLARGLTWFIIGLSPVIFLTGHAYAMYLSIASLGIIYILCTCIESLPRFQKSALLILGSVWFISSFLTVNFLRSNHWISNEQAISKAYSLFVKEEVKNPQHGSTFVFRNAQKDFSDKYNLTLLDSENILYQSLNGDSAIQVLYSDSSLKSIYLKNGKQSNFPPNATFYEISPKIK